MFRSVLASVFAAALAVAARAQSPAGAVDSSRVATAAIVKDIAPTGTLRAAINLGNSVLAQGPADAPRGVSVDLARELGRRLGVPVRLASFAAAGKTFETLKAGDLDVLFLAIEPVRAAEVDFTAPYVFLEGTYMTRRDSPLRDIADVDRDGVRIGVGQGSAYDLFLTRTLQRASLVRSSSPIETFLRDQLDVVGGVKQPLVEYARTHPDMKMMDGHFMLIQQAMGTPKGRGAATLGYLRAFIEDMKSSGFVADALERSHQSDARVAPSEK